MQEQVKYQDISYLNISVNQLLRFIIDLPLSHNTNDMRIGIVEDKLLTVSSPNYNFDYNFVQTIEFLRRDLNGEFHRVAYCFCMDKSSPMKNNMPLEHALSAIPIEYRNMTVIGIQSLYFNTNARISASGIVYNNGTSTTIVLVV